MFLFFLLFRQTVAVLRCDFNFTSIRLNSTDDFREPQDSEFYSSLKERSYCNGHLMIQYNQIDFPSFFHYSIGFTNHFIEREIERLAEVSQAKILIHYYFLCESFKSDSLTISMYILCQTKENCAVEYIRYLVNIYREQKNPLKEIRDVLYHSSSSSSLECFETKMQRLVSCVGEKPSMCVSYGINPNDYRACQSRQEARLEYSFQFRLTNDMSLDYLFKLFVCNRDGCNTLLIQKRIERIIANVTWRYINRSSSNDRSFTGIFLCLFIRIVFDDI